MRYKSSFVACSFKNNITAGKSTQNSNNSAPRARKSVCDNAFLKADVKVYYLFLKTSSILTAFFCGYEPINVNNLNAYKRNKVLI
jgi:hypothetical protein